MWRCMEESCQLHVPSDLVLIATPKEACWTQDSIGMVWMGIRLESDGNRTVAPQAVATILTELPCMLLNANNCDWVRRTSRRGLGSRGRILLRHRKRLLCMAIPDAASLVKRLKDSFLKIMIPEDLSCKVQLIRCVNIYLAFILASTVFVVVGHVWYPGERTWNGD